MTAAIFVYKGLIPVVYRMLTNKLYYTVQNRDIIILSLEDTRMNPNKVWNELQAD